jgi:exoribonuclease R
MDNDTFESRYTTKVEHLYGAPRDVETDMRHVAENIHMTTSGGAAKPHPYSIPTALRTDFTMKAAYSIDPPGCEDADDAFSIYTNDDDTIWMAIHIADPTELIHPESDLWNDIVERTITRYPSNRKPIHMMPKDIVDESSLMVNLHGDHKNAVTVLTEIDRDTFAPRGRIQLLFSTIKVDTERALTYHAACDACDTDFVLETGLKISSALMAQRAKKTLGTRLSEVNPSAVNYTDPAGPRLVAVDAQELAMKQMIAEFAIFANSFVGEYLKIRMGGVGIFRTCAAAEWLGTVFDGISGDNLLNEIITNGIQADYLSSNAAHDLVGAPEYCHFTSPIRRLADCTCHYLLKYLYLMELGEERVVPFAPAQLDDIAGRCLTVTKKIKTVQYRDVKFRLIQTMSGMLRSRIAGATLRITFFIASYIGGFLNVIICNIEEHKVHMSYSILVKGIDPEALKFKIKHNIEVSRIKCLGKYDGGSIPELDAFLQGVLDAS